MTLPPDLQKVLDIAARLAGGYEDIGIEQLRRGCVLACPGDPSAVLDLYELLLDHLDAELTAGLHGDPTGVEFDVDDAGEA